MAKNRILSEKTAGDIDKRVERVLRGPRRPLRLSAPQPNFPGLTASRPLRVVTSADLHRQGDSRVWRNSLFSFDSSLGAKNAVEVVVDDVVDAALQL